MDALPRLYVITDRDGGRAPEDVAMRAIEGGARFFQLRDKGLAGEHRRQMAVRLLDLLEAHHGRLLVNGDAQMAHDVGAHGVHRPAAGPPVGQLRAELVRPGLVGVSCHSLAEARQAASEGADFVTLSPIFPTDSKPGYGPPLGLETLAEVCEAVEVPVYALAGVTPERVAECREAGAYGAAVMGGIMHAEDPRAATGAYCAALATE